MKILQVSVVILAAEQGGRSSPVFSGYRPAFYFAGTALDGDLQLVGTSAPSAGIPTPARIRLLHPERLPESVGVGSLFDMREGSRVVGYGVIVASTVQADA
jgi:elongation factor Tu